MSFMNKVKNFFYEDVEEYDEPVVEEPKKEKKIDLNFFKKKEKDNEIETREERVKEIVPEKKNEDLSERELFKAERTFNFPMDLDEKIFDKEEEEEKTEVLYKAKEPERKPVQRTETKRPVTPSYTKPVYQNISREQPKKETEHKFHPSPVISPVYGILDKNYTVDDVVEKNLDKTKEFSFDKKVVDFDTVRNRAYKDLDDELEKTLTGNTDIFYNLTEEEPKEEKEENELEDSPVIITYNEEEEVKPEETTIDEMPSIPDPIEENTYEEVKEEPVIKQEEVPEEEEEEEDLSPDVKIEKTKSKKDKNSKKESKEEKEDLFNLIDNMYSEDDEEDDE